MSDRYTVHRRPVTSPWPMLIIKRLNTSKFHIKHVNFNKKTQKKLHNLQNRQVTCTRRTETMTRARPELISTGSPKQKFNILRRWILCDFAHDKRRTIRNHGKGGDNSQKKIPAKENCKKKISASNSPFKKHSCK